MKHLKLAGLLAVAAAALMASAGSASATILTSPEHTTYTGSIVATSTNSELTGSFQPVKCGHSAAEGDVTSHGGAEVFGHIDKLTFTECNYTTTVKTAGTLSIDGSNVVRSNGAEVSIATSVGTCVFTTSGTTIGNLIESSGGGSSAALDLATSKIPRTGGNFLCGSSGTWHGSYTVLTPAVLYVD